MPSNWKSHRLRRRREIDTLLDGIKRKEGCVICEERNPTVLDFHHVDKTLKSFSIATARSMGKYKIADILSEVAKCVVVCSNHHRQIEAGEIELPDHVAGRFGPKVH